MQEMTAGGRVVDDQCWLRGLKEFTEAREDSGNGRPVANELRLLVQEKIHSEHIDVMSYRQNRNNTL